MIESRSAIGIDEARLLTGRLQEGDIRLASEAIAILEYHYPGWPWHVHAQIDQGIIDVRNADLHHQWGYRVRLGEADTPELWARAIRSAGGELLERFGIPRGPRTEEALAKKKPASAVLAEALTEGRR